MKIIIRRWARESAQQRDVVTPRPQARTEGDEGHRVGLCATHGGQQDVIAGRGVDHHHGDAQEQGESMRDHEARHPRTDIAAYRSRYRTKNKFSAWTPLPPIFLLER